MLGRRSAAAALSLLVMLAALTPGAVAQSDSGEIDIVVVDTATKQPLELARVLLDGPVITSEITGKNGKVTFTDVPDGIYRARIVNRGYTALTSAAFEVLDGRVVTVNFALAMDTGGLKVIGQVTAKASATISTPASTRTRRSAGSPTDLADALNKLSGVSVSTSGDDSDCDADDLAGGPRRVADAADARRHSAQRARLGRQSGRLRHRPVPRRVGPPGPVARRPRRRGELQHAAADAQLEHANAALRGQQRPLQLLRGRNGFGRQARHRGADREPALPQPCRRRLVSRRERPAITCTTATARSSATCSQRATSSATRTR